ncbi:MAG: extracellular solute-binding protein [Clostridia bacterium]|nr:extracellular solute-binding protein [Clostridia bacterium]
MTKKILALILAVFMLVPMLASCGNEETSGKKDRDDREEREENENDDETGKGGNFLDGLFGADDEPAQSGQLENVPTQSENAEGEQNPSAVPVDPELKEIDDYVDELAAEYNFGGKTFTFVGGGSQAPSDDYETGDTVNDALYYRQRDIEEKFDVEFCNYVPESVDGEEVHPVVDSVRIDVMAGTHAYNAGYGTPVAVCQPLLQVGALTAVNDFEGIDLSRRWWTSTLYDTYTIGGDVYFLNGAIVTSNYTDANAVLFNRQIAEEYGISEFYSHVKDGTWTFDKMFELAGYVPTNEYGTGIYRYATPDGIAVLYANGYSVTKFDSDGMPCVPESLPRELDDFSTRFSAIFGDDTQTAHTKIYMSSSTAENFEDKYGYDDAYEMFASSKILFYFTTTGEAADLREEDVDFGILPLPKGSVSQDDYVSYAEPWETFNVFVPKSGVDTEMTGVILEAMAALGLRYIKGAYYDNLLQGRSTYDSDSREMLDIIYETKVYDLVSVIEESDGSSMYSAVLRGAIQETNQGIATKYALQARIHNTRIKSLLKTLENK